jgi:hypothetical protein
MAFVDTTPPLPDRRYAVHGHRHTTIHPSHTTPSQ